MFSLKLNLFFANWRDAKGHARKLNRQRMGSGDPRDLYRMRCELQAAQEHVRLMQLMHRNRMF